MTRPDAARSFLLGEVEGLQSLDIAHGSQRAEHEARQKLSALRARIEGVVSESAGRRPEQDEDGDYVLPLGGLHDTVSPRATGSGPVVVRVFAIQLVAPTADEWDDRLEQMFGGATYQEVLANSTRHESPPTKPGGGGYI